MDGELFSTLGVEPLLGRTLVPSDAVWGQASVILLSYDTWRMRFGGDTDVVGKTLWVEGRDRTVVGVMPQGFWISPSWGGNVAYWECNELGSMPTSRWMTKIGRLKPGIEPEQAAAETTPLIQRTEESLGNDPAGWNARVESLQQAFFGQIERGLLFFLGSVGFVLLIACANVANLLLARGAGRRKELALRSSLGAGRLRLTRQLLIEALLLAIGGGVLGALLSVWGNELFILWAPDWFPRTEEIGIDARVLAFTAALSLLTALVFGLLPALRVSKVNSNETLKEGGRGAGPRLSGRSRKLLLASEVALAMALLLGAGMMIQSFLKEMHADTGYRVEGLLRAEILLAGPRYYLDTEEPKPVTPQVADFYRQVLERVKALPGVESAGIISRLPPVQGWHPQPFTIVGRPDPPPGEEPTTDYEEVDAGLLETLDVPLLRGRFIDETDVESSPWVAVINETLAARHFPDGDPIGHILRVSILNPGYNITTPEDRPREIVGVIGDVRRPRFDAEPRPAVYVSHRQRPSEYYGGEYWTHIRKNLLVRTSVDPLSLTEPVRRAVAEVDPNQAAFNIMTVEEALSEALSVDRFYVRLLSLFAAMAVALAAIGIYGVASYLVGARMHEFGIRIALGAHKGDLLRFSLMQVMQPALIGVAAGFLGALALLKVLGAMVVGFSFAQPMTYVVVGLLMIGVSLLAGYLPARRATKVDPVTALRHE